MEDCTEKREIMSKIKWAILAVFCLCICSCAPSVVPSGGKVSLSLNGKPSDWAISDGKYTVNNLVAGSKLPIPFKIYNDSGSAKKISVIAKIPNNLTEGYKALPVSYVVINDSIVDVPAQSTMDIQVYLLIPDKTDISKSEVWVGFQDLDQKGMTRAQFCSKIRIE